MTNVYIFLNINMEPIPDDITKEIMLRTDIDVLKKLQHVSLKFLNEKLVFEGSIPIKMNNDWDLSHIVDEYGKKFNTDNLNIILYKLVKLAEHDAKMALLVNQIEKDRKYNPSFGQMSIELSGELLEYYYVLFNIIKPHLENIDHDTFTYNSIMITYDNGYKLDVNLFTNDEDGDVEFDITKSNAIDILTLMLFFRYTCINEDIEIVGRKNASFYYDHDKQSIYETLYQLEKKGLLVL